MPYYSNSSKQKLETCHQDLQTVFNYVIKIFDNTIVYGHRGKKAQNAAYEGGFSQLKYPFSKHNKEPSEAVDAVPYPIEWKNLDRMRFFIGFVLGIARMLYDYGAIEHEIVSGIDWDSDTILTDQRFNDFPHFQIKRD